MLQFKEYKYNYCIIIKTRNRSSEVDVLPSLDLQAKCTLNKKTDQELINNLNFTQCIWYKSRVSFMNYGSNIAFFNNFHVSAFCNSFLDMIVLPVKE